MRSKTAPKWSMRREEYNHPKQLESFQKRRDLQTYVILKACFRQTDRQTDRETKALITDAQTLDHSLRKMYFIFMDRWISTFTEEIWRWRISRLQRSKTNWFSLTFHLKWDSLSGSFSRAYNHLLWRMVEFCGRELKVDELGAVVLLVVVVDELELVVLIITLVLGVLDVCVLVLPTMSVCGTCRHWWYHVIPENQWDIYI